MIAQIIQQTGLKIKTYTPLSGGDINRAYCLISDEKKYFLKINEARKFPGMLEKESGGLQELSKNTTLKLPSVIQTGESGSSQFLILEWLEPGVRRKDFWRHFGNGLALMHLGKQEYFGFHENNYIGNLLQDNSKHCNWGDFYGQRRILPLVEKLFQSGNFSRSDVQNAEVLSAKLSLIFPEEHPSVLHGDLWSGNFMIGPDGNAAIYDPAMYYGHREIDIGMSLLFGGFNNEFYEGYEDVYPLERKWKSRVELTQLYPLLVHAILFGGSYIARSAEIIRSYA